LKWPPIPGTFSSGQSWYILVAAEAECPVQTGAAPLLTKKQETHDLSWTHEFATSNTMGSYGTATEISIAEKLESFDDRWSPKTIATVGDFAVKAVKIEGAFVWHNHADDDELFYVLRGGISMDYRLDGVEYVEKFGPGEMLRVPKGMHHRPVAEQGTGMLLFEREAVSNTGAVIHASLTNAAVKI